MSAVRSWSVPVGPALASAILVLLGAYVWRSSGPSDHAGTSPSFHSPPELGDVRIVSWNVGEAAAASPDWVDRVGEVLGELHPDVVLLQDVPGRDAVEAISAALPGAWRFTAAAGSEASVGDVAVMVRGGLGEGSRRLIRTRDGSTSVGYRVILPGGVAGSFVSVRGGDQASRRLAMVREMLANMSSDGRTVTVWSGGLHRALADCVADPASAADCGDEVAIRSLMLNRFADCVGVAEGVDASSSVYVHPKTVTVVRSAIVFGSGLSWTPRRPAIVDLRLQ